MMKPINILDSWKRKNGERMFLLCLSDMNRNVCDHLALSSRTFLMMLSFYPLIETKLGTYLHFCIMNLTSSSVGVRLIDPS